jgi:hypothetical protein
MEADNFNHVNTIEILIFIQTELVLGFFIYSVQKVQKKNRKNGQ